MVDEIFFLFLTHPNTRRELFDIHIQKRGLNPVDFNLDALVKASARFTGANIKQAISSGLYSICEGEWKLQSEDVLKEVQATKCLADLMPEKLDALREWARGPTVFAD